MNVTANIPTPAPQPPKTFDITDLTAEEFGYIVAALGVQWGHRRKSLGGVYDRLAYVAVSNDVPCDGHDYQDVIGCAAGPLSPT